MVVGLDIGTNGARAVVYDAEGRLLGQATRGYALHGERPRWAEQDPDEIIAAAADAIGEATARAAVGPAAVVGIGLSSVFHSVLALDARGEPLTRLLTWADSRAVRQSAELKALAGPAIYQRTGCPVHPMYLPAKIQWLRDERPDLFTRAHRFVSIKEYALVRWLGARQVDRSVASASGLFNHAAGTWDDEVLRLAGIGPDQLGEPVEGTTALGGLQADIAGRMGVHPGTAVVVGAGDGVLASLGAGAVQAGQMTCTIGTSGAVRIVSDAPRLDARERTWCYYLAEGRWVNGAAINNGGIVCQWAFEHLLHASRPFDFEQLERWAAASVPGARGLLFLPFLTGERAPHWNAEARGVLFGLAMSHTRDDIARAVFEGVSHRMRSIYLALAEVAGPVSEARATGGYTRSPFWLQLQADMLGQPLRVPTSPEASALGAAVLAMRAVGWLPSLDAVDRFVQLGQPVVPDPGRHSRYVAMHDLFMRVYWNLQAEFAAITAAQEQQGDV
ncbi:MAG: gluconokinase [Chloroflexi bacterium]|nr:gluconokinase [Chloroflexota bacterium]